jgi:hypothetical protein
LQGIDKNKIREYLTAIVDDSIDHIQLTELVKISRTIIQSYLLNYRSKIFNLISRHGISLVDLSYDCIAEAFNRNNENKYCNLKNFISCLNEDINDIEEINLFLAYKSFLIRITESQLSKLYSQMDPIGSKILRNIKDVLRTSDKFNLEKSLLGLSLIITNDQSVNLKPEYPVEKLMVDFEFDGKRPNTVNLLKCLYNILDCQTEFRKSLTLIDVVTLFKKYFNVLSDNKHELDERTLLSSIKNDEYEEMEIQQIKQKVENFVKEKILVNYFLKGKVNKNEAEAIYLTISDIINDWYYGVDTKESIHDYFVSHMYISKQEYLEKYRTKIEYLVKLARDEFADYLLGEI